MSECVECSTPYTGDPTQDCERCGETVSARCRDCSHYAADIAYGDRCEECENGHRKVVARERRDAMAEAYGDYLRDEGKDRRESADEQQMWSPAQGGGR